jgi:hypothetical protein
MPAAGLSSGVKINYSTRRGTARRSVVVKLNKSLAEVRKERKNRYDQLAGIDVFFIVFQLVVMGILNTALSFANREDLMDDDAEMSQSHAEDGAWEDSDDAGLYTLPPGEEGLAHSHAGDSIFQQIMEDIDPTCVKCLSLPSNLVSKFCHAHISLTESGATHACAQIAYRNLSTLGVNNCHGWSMRFSTGNMAKRPPLRLSHL